MRRRRSAAGKARKQFWRQEYWNISMSKLFSVTQLVALISSRNRSLNAFFGLRVLAKKNLAEYEQRLVYQKEAEPIFKDAERVYGWVRNKIEY